METKAKIIVVDDEESIRFSLKRILSGLGYDVETTSNLGEARSLISMQDFDVAIVDRMLSNGENGVDFLEELKITHPYCQAIMISAYPSYMAAIKSIEHNTFAYLTKPLEKSRLSKVIKQALTKCGEAKNSDRINALFKSLFNTLATPLAIYDFSGSVVFVNPAFTTVFGYTARELAQLPLSHVPDWDKDKTKSDHDRIISGEIVPERDTKRLSKKGQAIDVKISLSLCKEPKGNTGSILTILRDIRQDKIMEKHLIQENRMEAISALSSGMVHDFNNLLMVKGAIFEIFLPASN